MKDWIAIGANIATPIGVMIAVWALVQGNHEERLANKIEQEIQRASAYQTDIQSLRAQKSDLLASVEIQKLALAQGADSRRLLDSQLLATNRDLAAKVAAAAAAERALKTTEARSQDAIERARVTTLDLGDTVVRAAAFAAMRRREAAIYDKRQFTFVYDPSDQGFAPPMGRRAQGTYNFSAFTTVGEGDECPLAQGWGLIGSYTPPGGERAPLSNKHPVFAALCALLQADSAKVTWDELESRRTRGRRGLDLYAPPTQRRPVWRTLTEENGNLSVTLVADSNDNYFEDVYAHDFWQLEYSVGEFSRNLTPLSSAAVFERVNEFNTKWSKFIHGAEIGYGEMHPLLQRGRITKDVQRVQMSDFSDELFFHNSTREFELQILCLARKFSKELNLFDLGLGTPLACNSIEQSA